MRFTTKGKTLYAIILGSPTNSISIKSLGTSAGLLAKPVSKITLLGSKEKLKWSQTADAVVIEPVKKPISDIAIVFAITPKG